MSVNASMELLPAQQMYVLHVSVIHVLTSVLKCVIICIQLNSSHVTSTSIEHDTTHGNVGNNERWEYKTPYEKCAER